MPDNGDVQGRMDDRTRRRRGYAASIALTQGALGQPATTGNASTTGGTVLNV